MHTEFSRWLRTRMQPWALLMAQERAWPWLHIDQLSAEAANDGPCGPMAA